MRGLCDARGCQERARWYAVAHGGRGRAAFNVSACDGHRGLRVVELAQEAGFEGMVENLLAWMGAGAEVGWEHIGGT